MWNTKKTFKNNKNDGATPRPTGKYQFFYNEGSISEDDDLTDSSSSDANTVSENGAAESTSNIANIDNAESFVMKEAMESVVSNFKVANFGAAYKKDTDRSTTPDDLTKRLNTIREVGMEDCVNPFIKSMQAQSFIAWSSFINLSIEGDISLSNNETNGGGFHDGSYILTQKDEGYVLKMKFLSLVPNLTILEDNTRSEAGVEASSAPQYFDADYVRKTDEVVKAETKTRNFKEAISSYSEINVLFKTCAEEEFNRFAEDNKLEGTIKEYVPTDNRSYLIPEILSADYKIYISPIFNKYNVKNSLYDAAEDIREIGIKRTNNPLDIRLGFISGALTDALGVSNLSDTDKDKHIKYALLNVKELFDSEYIDNKDLESNEYFKKIISYCQAKELSPENEQLLITSSDNYYDTKIKVIASNLETNMKNPSLGYWEKNELIKDALENVMDTYSNGSISRERVLASNDFTKIKTILFAQNLNEDNECSLSLKCKDYLGEKLEFINQLIDKGDDKDITHALYKLKELVDSKNITKNKLIEHPSFNKMIISLNEGNMNIESQLQIASFFNCGPYNYAFGKAVSNSIDAQSLFIKLVINSRSAIIANEVAGLGLKIRARMIEELPNDFISQEDFSKVLGDCHNFKDAEEKSKVFEAREHTMLTIGVIATACLIGSGYGLGVALLTAFGVGVFVLCAVAVYSFGSEKTMQQGNMKMIHHEASVAKSDSFKSSYMSSLHSDRGSLVSRPSVVAIRPAEATSSLEEGNHAHP